jgi:hypothetical protein
MIPVSSPNLVVATDEEEEEPLDKPPPFLVEYYIVRVPGPALESD